MTAGDVGQLKCAAPIGKREISTFTSARVRLHLSENGLYRLTYDRKNNAAKDGSSEVISAALSVTIDDCKRLWKNLRHIFTKERRNLTMGLDGPTSDWPHYKKMLFNSQYFAPRRCRAPKQISEDTETSCSSGNFPENDQDVGESETSWRENRRFGEPERRLPTSDDVGAFRPATVGRMANGFALHLSHRLNEMTPAEARDKRKVIISAIIEDLKY